MAKAKGTKAAKSTRRMKTPAKAGTRKATRTRKAIATTRETTSGAIQFEIPEEKVNQMIACISGVLATHEIGAPFTDRTVLLPERFANVGTGGSARDELRITVIWER